ncbi:unnamed protein product [Leptidea sinapis]|uniref:Uncharacterized protein n=1 Tax=Leptidea sinapis TaxID=189913 RepID=A0A5E4R6E4_9NEOP|nr:unnamed protein product [Leptidea sinapis]
MSTCGAITVVSLTIISYSRVVTLELSAWINVTLLTILTHLRQINKMKKYEMGA